MRSTYPLVVAFLVSFAAAGAPVVNLTNTTDFALRSAIASGGTINLFGTNIVALTNTLVFSKDTELDATAGDVTLRCDGYRALDIASGIIQLRGITIANSGGNFPDGGGLRNVATAIVERCTFVGNLATNGSGSGGAIYNIGTLLVSESTFASNAGVIAAAIMNAGRATILRSTFTSNRGNVTVSAGDIFRQATSSAITNCTFAFNQGDALGVPSQIFPVGPYGPTWISHCTIAGNTGYGVSLAHGPGIPTASSSVLVINSAFSSNTLGSAVAALTDLGGNATSDASTWFTNANSFTNLDLKLSPLAMNGGFTATMVPQAGSPLIDRLPDYSSAPVDQRGVSRPIGPLSDIGAVEASAQGGDVYFATAMQSVAEGEPFITVLVSRLAGAPGSGTVEFFTTAETAIAGSDFIPTNGVLSFADGESSKSITVAIVNDVISDAPESFLIGLRNPTGSVTLGPIIQTRIRIIDDEVFVLSNCSQAALNAALATATSIRFDCDAAIVLTNTILVSDFLQLDGNGHSVTISGGGLLRPFEVGVNAQLILNGLTISNGSGALPGQGGAIRNRGKVVATDCLFISNSAIGETGTAGQYMVAGAGPGGNAEGGAIWNDGAELLLTNVVFSGNRIIGGTGGPLGTLPPPNYGGPGGMASGGAIHASMSRVIAVGCTFQTNRAVPGSPGQGSGRTANSGLARGGAISALNSDVLLSNIVMHGQMAGGTGFVNHALGGAIFQERGTLNAIASTFSSNIVAGGSGVVNSTAAIQGGNGLGGAVALSNAISGQASRFTACSFVFNRAIGGAQVPGPFGPGYAGSGRGGAIFSGGSTEFANCTLAHNTATGGPLYSGAYSSFTGEGQGGAVFVATGFVSAVHCTIASNVIARTQSPLTLAPSVGGSAIFANDDTHPSIQNTILASASGLHTHYGPLTDLGGNISSDVYANLTHPTSLNNVDPRLAPLADYAGPTLTMALLEGSPAIDAALMTATPQAIDQRGRARPTTTGADIGAFESSPPWTLRGQIVGYPSTAGIPVDVGSSNVITDALGRYRVDGLSSGTIELAPFHPDWIFDPFLRTLNVSRDVIGVNFDAYFKGFATPKRESPATLRVSYASREPRVIVAQASSNLVHWVGIATNETGPLLHVVEPIGGQFRFYRFMEGAPIPPAP